MDSKDRFHVLIMPAVLFFIQVGDQRGLPVMAVHHIRVEIDVWNKFQYGTAEENKPFCFIVIAVQTRTFEVVFVVDKIERHIIAFVF